MEIKRMNANAQNDRKMQYKLTKSPNVQKLKDAVGQTIMVKAFCFYDDHKEGEQEKLILTLMDASGVVYGTNSKTAMSNFNDILEIFGEDVDGDGVPVLVDSSVSKNGREFIMLILADNETF